MSRNLKWKNRRDPMSKFWVLLHLVAHTWNTIFYYYAVLLIKWKQVIGLGHQNKFSLEIRMLALALQWITCLTLFPDLQNGSFKEDTNSQLSITVIWGFFLKAQIPQAPLTPAKLESPRVWPREFKRLWADSQSTLFPGERTPYLETIVLENLLRANSSPNPMILKQQLEWYFRNREW